MVLVSDSIVHHSCVPTPRDLFVLEQRLGETWRHLRCAHERTLAKRAELTEGLRAFDADDTTIVALGSLGRGEFTEGSDLDWTLLVDGAADARHLDITREVAQDIARIVVKPPGREGTFGNLLFSHELVHLIGGEDDTNRNTTLRCLLLLESIPLGRPDAYDAVLTAVLNRYLTEDRAFARRVEGRFHVPRFLANDFARYWRTVAVDFAYKRRERHGEGAAIRNLKLRFSRKLLYVSALLSCFSCELGCTPNGGRATCALPMPACVRCLDSVLSKTPLDVVASACLHYLRTGAGSDADNVESIARDFFRSYDTFLGMLSNRAVRDRLERLAPDKLETDEVFNEGRVASRVFDQAVLRIFFELAPDLTKLTQFYGVF